MTPSVSVIMSVTNRPNHIKNALRSWKNVQYPDWDFTLIDDATNNPEIENIARNAGFSVQFYREDMWHNINVVWNKYGKASKGEYVVFAMADEIVSHPDIFQKMLACPPENRTSIFTYFMNKEQSESLPSGWEDDPTIIPLPPTTDTTAGLISHITGNYRANWEWFGWFRDDETGHLWLDQDVHLREVCVWKPAHTPKDVYCLHQWHPAVRQKDSYYTPGYSYATEAQARLLEPAKRDGS